MQNLTSNVNNNKKRKIADIFRLIPTYLSTIFLVITLVGIILYVLIQGLPNFNLKLLTSDNAEHLDTITVTTSETKFDDPNIAGSYFIPNFGIAVTDSKTVDGNDCVIVTYVASNSPLKTAVTTADGSAYSLETGVRIDAIRCQDENGLTTIIGANKGAERIAKALSSAVIINQMQCKTSGGGARGSLITTFYLILITLLVALPIGVGAAIFLEEYAKPGRLKTILLTMIDMTSGIPSIIFGFCGALIFIPFCDGTFKTSGFSILAGAFTMVIVLLPTIIKTTSESLKVIPSHFTMASLALGASKTQTVFKVILPNAIPGILTATLLSIGRIIGESAALIFVMGTSIQDDISITKASTSLSLHIWSIMQGENPNYATASAIAIFILIVVLVLSIFVKLISKKMNKMVVGQ